MTTLIPVDLSEIDRDLLAGGGETGAGGVVGNDGVDVGRRPDRLHGTDDTRVGSR